MTNKEIITNYFKSWIKKDSKIIEEFFTDNIKYVECYGPVYSGKKQCLQWFKDWNEKGSVIKWDIYNIYQDKNVYTIEWFFECDYEGNIDCFDGVSIIEFTNSKISSVKEFQSKHIHHYPYGNE